MNVQDVEFDKTEHMKPTIPYRLNAADFLQRYQCLQEWADDNAQLLRELILHGGETLGSSENEAICILEVWSDDEELFSIEINTQNADKTMKINEDHWVMVEDYIRAARARDARGYIQKRIS